VREPAQLYYGSISAARVIKDYFWYSLAVHIFRDTDRGVKDLCRVAVLSQFSDFIFDPANMAGSVFAPLLFVVEAITASRVWFRFVKADKDFLILRLDRPI
jgi:hypothetical protein